MVLLPAAKLLPLTVRLAPEAANETLPRLVAPSENVTLPVGWAVPLAALTVAVSCVDPVDAMVAGLAATDVVVLTNGEVTVTVVEPLELEFAPVWFTAPFVDNTCAAVFRVPCSIDDKSLFNASPATCSYAFRLISTMKGVRSVKGS